MFRKSAAILAILCAFAVGLSFNAGKADAVGVNPAASGVFYCVVGPCKYAQGKVEYTATTVNHLSWWGSTASGTCDPSNDVKRWQLQGTSLYNDTTNVKIYNYTSGSWKTNCEAPATNSPPWAYYVSPNKSRPSNASAHFWWKYEQNDGRNWYAYLRADF